MREVGRLAAITRSGVTSARPADILSNAMPTYVYKFIDTDETIEVQQSFSDDTLTEYAHPETGETMPVKKVFLPVGVTFKGDGFYKTDNRPSSKKSTGSTSADTSSTSSDSSKSSDSSASSATSTATPATSSASTSSSSSNSSGD